MDGITQIIVGAIIGLIIILIDIRVKRNRKNQLNSIQSTINEVDTNPDLPAGKEIKSLNVSDIEAMSIKELSDISQFIAFDFETANDELSSACSLGLAFSDAHQVFATRHFYIKPTPNHFEPSNIKIHGITPDMVKDAPTFDVIAAQLEQMSILPTMIAHNLDFDATVWREAAIATMPSDLRGEQGKTLTESDKRMLLDQHIQLPMECACTLKLSRIAYPYLDAYKLDDVCREIGYDLQNHHDATADATATANIAIDICRRYNLWQYLYAFAGIEDHIHYKLEDMRDVRWMKPWGKARRLKEAIHNHISGDILVPPQLDLIENKDTPFFGKKVVITGSLANFEREKLAFILKGLGADIQSTVSKRLNYIIVGERAGWAKMQKVEECNAAGADIKILSENDLIQILSNIK